LVAGARYVNYMQIEIEPFPLVASLTKSRSVSAPVNDA